ncbi:MAG: hypothetical protein LBB88_10120 [Planctomycetaceae bacterium]|nr:hypothetical protein [Planctomycetaceae bacterium]
MSFQLLISNKNVPKSHKKLPLAFFKNHIIFLGGHWGHWGLWGHWGRSNLKTLI